MNYFIFNPDSSDKVALQIKEAVEKKLKSQQVFYKTEDDIGLSHFEKSQEQYILKYENIEKIFQKTFNCFILCWSNVTDATFYPAMLACALFWEQQGKEILVFYEKNTNNYNIAKSTLRKMSEINSYSFV